MFILLCHTVGDDMKADHTAKEVFEGVFLRHDTERTSLGDRFCPA